MQLNQSNLSRLPEELNPPSYDRSRIKAGIVHVGVGGFHRSHEAYYTDELMRSSDTSDASAWGICGVGLREADRKIAKVLRNQDCLYTLIVKDPGGDVRTRVIGSLVDVLLGCDDPMAVIEQMASSDTKIVSLTITEGGYNVDPASGDFDTANADAIHDVQNPQQPRLVFGYLTAALRLRRERGLPAITVQSCDNIQHNGDLTRKMLLGFARMQDADLVKWIEDEVCFPNAMVDRITPVTSSADIDYLHRQLDLDDAWPVTCEPFCQWIIEDNFSNGRPEWEKVGAQFVTDVTPFETMKLRLLNAGHSVLGLLGSLFGYQTIDQTLGDELFVTFLRGFFDDEATPMLDAVEGIDLGQYKSTLIERFGNPNIKDSLARICLESSSKLPVFLLPTIRRNLEQGGPIAHATLVIAAWCYYSEHHTDRHGNPLDVVDEQEAALQQAARKTIRDPLAFIKLESVFGNLAEDGRFAETYEHFVQDLYRNPDVSILMRQATVNDEAKDKPQI
ncbi:mannitol dehydrogenase family protein [Aureliella helgolandensis]|uniref:Polyol:NADP oxidoreductase n=1 Tax=Aureliella helgolandensis TaxID=2527968 RepID=A0A518G9M3_9BACT|nr:mannitol dehydrogenase family protein [Aureliella helgolandensis]QDV25273.1 Polyol:NADP oxidoreductase [Aureliella helgolandensis]